MSSIQCKAKELLTYHRGCHGNLVTTAMRYVDDAYCPIRQSELLMYHCCCHGNLVTMATRYVADANLPIAS